MIITAELFEITAIERDAGRVIGILKGLALQGGDEIAVATAIETIEGDLILVTAIVDAEMKLPTPVLVAAALTVEVARLLSRTAAATRAVPSS